MMSRLWPKNSRFIKINKHFRILLTFFFILTQTPKNPSFMQFGSGKRSISDLSLKVMFHLVWFVTSWSISIYSFGDELTSFHGIVIIWLWGLNGDRPNCNVTAPPPLTRRSNHPSSRVRVNPSRGVLVLTRTPMRPKPRAVVTLPRTTAERLQTNNNLYSLQNRFSCPFCLSLHFSIRFPDSFVLLHKVK